MQPAESSEEGYLASLSDLMVGLLFIFIIILMAFALNLREAEDSNTQETERQRQQTVQLQQQTQELQQQTVVLQQETHQQQQEQQRLQAETAKLKLEQFRLMQETEARIDEQMQLLSEKQDLELVIERLTNNNAVRRSLLQEIQADLANRGVRVFVDEKNGILRLPEELLFDTAAATFRPAGQQAIQQLANVLADVLPCYSGQSCPDKVTQSRLEAVLIEGHTDDRPIQTREFPDNWALASARALNTYRALIQSRPLLDVLKNSREQALLSVSAYAARRPVTDSSAEDNRRRNRRIDLRFLMASPPPELIEKAQQRLQ